MHVKNHMALWSLWFLWFLRIEYSGNPLCKPLCAFLVFVDLVWFLCGQLCGFWSCVVFGCGLALDAVADDCASTWRRSLWICGFWLWSCPRCAMQSIARPLVDGLCGSVVLRVHLPSMLDAGGCASDRAHVVFVTCNCFHFGNS